jgi:hypothetical protein
MLQSGLFYKSKPLLESFMAECTEKGVLIKNVDLDVVGVYAAFPKSYFASYDSSILEDVPLTSTILDNLSYFTSQKVTVQTIGREIVVEGERETYRETMLEREKRNFPIPMVFSSIGFLPQKMAPKVQVKILSDELSSVPSSENYKLVSDGSCLKIQSTDIGMFEKKINVLEKKVLEPITVAIDAELLQHILANTYGECWLSIEDRGIVLSQKTEDFAKTYLQSTLEVV